MKNIDDYKIGDTIIIIKKPSCWSSNLSCKNPFLNRGYDSVIYPYTCKIISLRKLDSHTAMKDNKDYGWDMDSLVNADCILSIKEQRSMKIKNIIHK